MTEVMWRLFILLLVLTVIITSYYTFVSYVTIKGSYYLGFTFSLGIVCIVAYFALGGK